jgi:hypothetical protein
MESFTLEQFSYIADVVGMIAVVASLIYVGKQIQLNNQEMRVSAARTYAQVINDLQFSIALNRDFAEVWVKGGAELAGLDEVDKTRVISLELIGVYNWYHVFGLRQQNLLSDREWLQIEWAMENFGKRESVRESWKWMKGGFDISFQNFMAQYLE